MAVIANYTPTSKVNVDTILQKVVKPSIEYKGNVV